MIIMGYGGGEGVWPVLGGTKGAGGRPFICERVGGYTLFQPGRKNPFTFRVIFGNFFDFLIFVDFLVNKRFFF